ncbi:MAG: hypothetical protein IJN22_02115 [Clostridia bacterium]|nr:hypothetical protein [Clostridia bacterium]
MKTSQKKNKLIFKKLKSPYMFEETESLSAIFQRYLEDTNSVFEVSGLTYYKIIECFEFKIKDKTTLVTLDSKMDLKLEDKLIDENGITYNIKAFEMFRLSTAIFPDWYLKICFVALDGDPYNIGDYLARLPRKETIEQ